METPGASTGAKLRALPSRLGVIHYRRGAGVIGRSVPSPGTRAPRPARYAIALVRYRRPIEEVVAATEVHRAYLRQLKADGRLIAAGPMDPRYGGIFLLKVSDENPQRALDAIRDGDPFHQQHIAQYELLCWNVVLGRDDLDRISS